MVYGLAEGVLTNRFNLEPLTKELATIQTLKIFFPTERATLEALNFDYSQEITIQRVI